MNRPDPSTDPDAPAESLGGPRPSEDSSTNKKDAPESGFSGVLKPFQILDRSIAVLESVILTAGILMMAASTMAFMRSGCMVIAQLLQSAHLNSSAVSQPAIGDWQSAQASNCPA